MGVVDPVDTPSREERRRRRREKRERRASESVASPVTPDVDEADTPSREERRRRRKEKRQSKMQAIDSRVSVKAPAMKGEAGLVSIRAEKIERVHTGPGGRDRSKKKRRRARSKNSETPAIVVDDEGHGASVLKI